MTKSTLLALIRKKFGHFKQSHDEIQVKCPYCPKLGQGVDRKYKLYINVKKQVYNCFRCGKGGRLKDMFPELENVEVKTTVEEPTPELEYLPEGVQLHELQRPWTELVFGFLLDKGFSPATVDKAVYFCENYQKNTYDYGPCLIFPIYQFGQYRGFQARTIYKNTIPKYIGATGMDKSSILYNYDTAFSQKERLIVTEGFFDCLKSGNQAIATLGKGITDKQVRLIKLGDFKDVVVFLDKDAQKEARETAKKIALYFHTYLAVPTKKDPGEMGRMEIQEFLNNKNNLERIY